MLKGLLHAELPGGPLSSHPACCPASPLPRAAPESNSSELPARPSPLESASWGTQPATGVPLSLLATALGREEDEENDLCVTGEDLLQIELEST